MIEEVEVAVQIEIGIRNTLKEVSPEVQSIKVDK